MKKIIFFLSCSVFSLGLVAQVTLPVTDNFDSYTNFTINPSGIWSFVDGDASTTYGFAGITFPNAGNAMAFIVFNPSATTPALTSATAHSGNKMLASFSSISSSNNDWLISPELSGNEVVRLTFWASSVTDEYGLERLKVGYSTTTAATSAFTFVQSGNYMEVPMDWTEYSFTFPVGTKYIALNCVSNNAFILFIDDITISSMSTPSITANPSSLDYGTIITGNSATQTVSIGGFNFTDNITATASSNDFTVSSDGTNFASTATLPAAGGTLSVKYNPTAAGNATATITLSATGATPLSINLIGAAIECNPITSYPYFNSLNQRDLCWSIFDDNNDENTFEYYNELGAVYFFNDTAPANDWLISPAFVINQPNLEVTFQYLAVPGYPEKISVWAITDLNDHTNGTALITTMNVVNGTPLSIPFTSLSAFNGQTIHIGIKCESDADMYALVIADFEIKEYPTSPTLWTEKSSLDFGIIVNGEEKVQTVAIRGISLTGAVNITSANANFEVSLDGITYNSTISVPVTGIMTMATLNVKYVPTAASSHNGEITLSSADATNVVINLSGEAIDCETKTVPYSEGFEGNMFPTICWKNIDNDGDGQTWFQSANSISTPPHSGEYCAVSASWSSGTVLYPDNYLITPAIQLPAGDCVVSFWICGQDASFAAENYIVKVSTTGTNPSDFTHTIFSSTSTDQWTNHQLALSQFAGQIVYIAFIHTNSSDMFQIKLDDIEVRADVGIEENTETFNVNIFPNPASLYIHINATSTVERIEIYNVSGQLVHSEEVNNMNATINTLNMSAGMYYAKVYTQTGVNTTKISIVK